MASFSRARVWYVQVISRERTHSRGSGVEDEVWRRTVLVSWGGGSIRVTISGSIRAVVAGTVVAGTVVEGVSVIGVSVVGVVMFLGGSGAFFFLEGSMGS